ncbi:MAG: glutamate racemase [Bacteroidetes bacterium]|nr:MAG: glutamate racemase [Bacteroidota bacterium]TAG85424.1 MAG: glutamate racemase [Bacteroidota bacterium]
MDNPIGIFDSGLGGISVWIDLIKQLPKQHFIYVADSANCPYGEKSKEEIQKLSQNIVNFLIKKGCKMIVIACNTATSAAIQLLRENFLDIYFIGIEPATKPAALHTKTGKIGVLATKSTLNGDLFQQTKEKFAQNIEVLVQIGEGLVELVEQNKVESQKSFELLEQYLLPMLAKKADFIVLGCTHYPFLMPIIEKIVKNKAIILNPASAVARQTEKILLENKLENNIENKYSYSSSKKMYEFFTSGKIELLTEFVYKYSPIVLDKENSFFGEVFYPEN